MKSLFEVPAPAKINLFLHVLGRRADGYHRLQSVFALIDWADTLHFERRTDGRLCRHDLTLPLPEDDLCLRAARALQQASGTTFGVDLSIDKQVPSGAGLGGGSSDAATTLLALNRLWGLDWPRERLAMLALPLGADVPFFIGGRNAWVEGIGEQLTPIDLTPTCWAVLKPQVSVPTAAIFSSAALVRDTAPATLRAFFADPCGFGHNDLQAAAQAYSIEVTQALEFLRSRCGASRMSGSGSAVFAQAGTVGAVDGGSSFDPFANTVLPSGWVGRVCRGLAAHPLIGWASDAQTNCGSQR